MQTLKNKITQIINIIYSYIFKNYVELKKNYNSLDLEKLNSNIIRNWKNNPNVILGRTYIDLQSIIIIYLIFLISLLSFFFYSYFCFKGIYNPPPDLQLFYTYIISMFILKRLSIWKLILILIVKYYYIWIDFIILLLNIIARVNLEIAIILQKQDLLIDIDDEEEFVRHLVTLMLLIILPIYFIYFLLNLVIIAPYKIIKTLIQD